MVWMIVSQVLIVLECFLSVEFVTRYNGIDWTRRICRVAFYSTFILSCLVVWTTNARIENIQARLLIRTAILFIYSLYFLGGPPVGKILSNLFFPFILLMAQTFCALFLSLLSPEIPLHQIGRAEGWNQVMYQFITLLILFYSTRMFLRFRRSYHHPYRKIHILMSILIPLITLLYAGLLAELITQDIFDTATMILLILSMFGVVIINLVMYYLMSDIGNEGDLVMENEMLRRYLTYEQRNMDEQKRIYEQIRAIRHELKNHLALLKQHLIQGDQDEALQLIDRFQGEITQMSARVQTDNETLNFILNTQISRAGGLGISVKVRVEESRIPCSDIDLHSLLGNMLSNAIEALETVPEGKRDLQIEVAPKAGYVSLVVRNRIEISVLESNPHLLTTKENVSRHGFGVRIIRALASKYEGHVDFYEQDSFFCVQVLIPQEEIEMETFEE